MNLNIETDDLLGSPDSGSEAAPSPEDWGGATEVDPNNAVVWSGGTQVEAVLNGSMHRIGTPDPARLEKPLDAAFTPGDGLRVVVDLISSTGLATGHGIGVGVGSSPANAVYGLAYRTGTGWSASLPTWGANPPTADGNGRSADRPDKLVFCMSFSDDNGNRKVSRTLTLLDADGNELASGVAHSITPQAMAAGTDLDTLYLISHDQSGNAAEWVAEVTVEHSNNAQP